MNTLVPISHLITPDEPTASSNEDASPSVYQAIADHQISEIWHHRELMEHLHTWVELFKFEFKLEFEELAVTIKRLRGNALGRFRGKHNGFGFLGEIAIDERHIQENADPKDWYDVMGTLLHEMLHVWQQAHGKPGKGNYHNKEFRDKALECGLLVDASGVQSYVAGGRFFQLLSKKGIDVPNVSEAVPQKQKPEGTGSKLKLWKCRCPENIRVGKKSLRILCLQCNSEFKPENESAHSESCSPPSASESPSDSVKPVSTVPPRTDEQGSNGDVPALVDAPGSLSSNATYGELFLQIHGHEQPAKVLNTSSNADIISDARGFMSGFDKTMQLQVGCPGGCLYCYVIRGYRLAPKDVRTNWGYEVRNKVDVAKRLQKHLLAGNLADKTMYWSGVTDPGAASPQVTRSVWETLIAAEPHLRPRRITVQTRMMRANRDVELMEQYAEQTRPADDGPPIVISYSIGTDRNDLIRAWELRTPLFEDRLKAISAYRASGIWVIPTLSPFGLWNDLSGTMSYFKSLEIPYVTALFIKKNTGVTTTPKPFLDHVIEHYPMLFDAQWQSDRELEICSVMGKGGVRIGKAGFDSLASPHTCLKETVAS